MPLHLLGKKSWNVYNQENIDRVRCDEAAAEAREAAEEQAMQEADARRRMKLLRGEPEDEPEPEVAPSSGRRSASPRSRPQKDERLGLETTYGDRDRKRKRQRGEDDTDRDMRYAKRMVEDRGEDDERRIARAGKIEDDAELVDYAGHINLFPAEAKAPSREEIRAARDGEKKGGRKDRELNEPPVMRMSEAAGRSRGVSSPWYSSSKHPEAGDDQTEQVRRDVWGNEDPNRKSRDQARMSANDPLAAMMAGVKQVRKVEADRKKWRQERDAELRSLQKDEERHRRRREKHRHEDIDELNGFSLDAEIEMRRTSHHHRHRSRQKERSHSHSDRDRARHRPKE